MTTTLELLQGYIYNGTSFSGGVTYNLSDRTKYIHIGNDGFGLPEFERFMDTGPLQEGATDRGFKLNPRKIQLVLNMVATTALEYWQRREELIKMFTPYAAPFTLKFTTPVRTYYIDCYTEGGLTFTSSEKQGYVGHRATIQLIAPDPTLYSIPNVTQTLLSGTQSLPRETNFSYTGGYKMFPVITIKGNITNPTITSYDELGNAHAVTITRVISTGSTNDVTIDTTYGVKSVKVNGSSILSDVSGDLSTIAIFPRPVLNTARFIVNGSSTNANTLVTLQYTPRYIGV